MSRAEFAGFLGMIGLGLIPAVAGLASTWVILYMLVGYWLGLEVEPWI